MRAGRDGNVARVSASPPQEPGASAADLRPQDVELLFTELLGRAATPAEIELWMQAGSLRALLDGVTGSQEYRDRVLDRSPRAAGRQFLNSWIAGSGHLARPAGELSPDGVAIVGEQGHLFIHGGANDNLRSHRGEIEMAPGWMDSWRALMEQRLEQSSEAGRSLVCVVFPEKLAVYGDLFPHDLTPLAPRPVLSLLEAGLALIYPQDELIRARDLGDTYLRTDSHLTVRGNQLMATAVLDSLSVTPDFMSDFKQSQPYLAAGDLGSHFRPPVLEQMTLIASPSRASILSDNRAQVQAVGGHIGTIRVFRNDEAPDGRTVVVFGDSYGFGDDAYQGLSWYLAQVFREVHLLWVPFGWDPGYLDSVRADVAVCETAERFIRRVPAVSVDARSLARETVERRAPLAEGRIFESA